MIKKDWSDIRIYQFCKHNRYTEVINESKMSVDVPFIEVTFFSNRENAKYLKLREWILDNCKKRVDICQWHLGYDNKIFLRFYNKTDLQNFYRFYDKLLYPKVIDVEVSNR